MPRHSSWPHRVANFLTVSRILLVPPFVVFLLREGVPGTYTRALVVYMILSDLLDGPMARRGRGKNLMGQFLDPLGDKLMVGLGYLVLSLKSHLIPLWLTALVLGRFIVLRGLWGLVFWTSGMDLGSFLGLGNILTRPNWLGKLAADTQMGLFLVVIFPFPEFLRTVGTYIVAGLTGASGVFYLLLSARAIRDAGILMSPKVRWRALGRVLHRASSVLASFIWGRPADMRPNGDRLGTS
ncbi:MAG: hypothetical protein DRP95_03885 [Candidatus Latescibacterota bacterium]|nr:MAG: hypothetical protein DRP95_03885 [Candidatus Latescibacterota bacterium]